MAWQPLTFGGVAAFAHAPWRRLWFVQLWVAALSAGCLIWFVTLSCLPVFDNAIGLLPNHAGIANGQFSWDGPSPARLAEGPFLALVMDLEGTERFGQAADIQLEFSRHHWEAASLLGRFSAPYPQLISVNLDHDVVDPWWNAWQPFLLVGLAVGWILMLFMAWALLSLIYAPAVGLLGWLMNRDNDWAGTLKLAGAALMPGAVFLSISWLLFGYRRLELMGFLVAFGLHLVVGWIYVLLGPTCLPPHLTKAGQSPNPFDAPVANPSHDQPRKPKNPFVA